MKAIYMGYTGASIYAFVLAYDPTGRYNRGQEFKRVCHDQNDVENELERYKDFVTHVLYKEDMLCSEIKTAL